MAKNQQFVMHRLISGKIRQKALHDQSPECVVKADLRTAKHVDGIAMMGSEPNIDYHTKNLENTVGRCTVHKHDFKNLGGRVGLTSKIALHGND